LKIKEINQENPENQFHLGINLLTFLVVYQRHLRAYVVINYTSTYAGYPFRTVRCSMRFS
jgi:hypothetical protein